MFRGPFTLILSGATGSGKTQWLIRFLKHYRQLIIPEPNKIFYCYGEINDSILGLMGQGVEIFNGVPDPNKIKEQEKPLLLILDDLMLNMQNNVLDLLFTRGSHNWNVSVIFVTQSLYGKDIKIARANAHYLVLMRNPSGQLQIRTLGSQLFPKRLNYFMDAYNDATNKHFSYLLINMHPNTEEEFRLSTKIFPGEKLEIYLPNE